jgi:DNA-3-methyladenine glycosylase II
MSARPGSRRDFIIKLAGPIDFAASFEIFRRSGDDMLDRWDGELLLRMARAGEKACAYACRPTGTLESPALRVTTENPRDREIVEHAIRSSFVSVTEDFEKLCHIDPVIARIAEAHRGFRPVLQLDLLGALVRCISAQQVNLKWASTVRRRLAEAFGRVHHIGEQVVYSLDATRLAALDVSDIRALQFTTRKAEYVINAARAIADGWLQIDALAAMADDEVIARITTVRGLGLWTAEWVLARTLGRPRISAGDLGVRKAVGLAYYGGRMPTPDEVRAATAHWGEAAALAQGMLLHAQHEKTLHRIVADLSAESRSLLLPRRAS